MSYAHDDKPVARAIAERLSALGVRVWIDEGELRAGDSIIERVSAAVAEVNFVAALVSVASVRSTWCRKELALAVAEGLRRENVRVLPLRLGSVEMPPALSDVFYLSVDSDDPGKVAPRIVQDAKSHLAGAPSWTAPQSTGAEPSLTVEQSELVNAVESIRATGENNVTVAHLASHLGRSEDEVDRAVGQLVRRQVLLATPTRDFASTNDNWIGISRF